MGRLIVIIVCVISFLSYFIYQLSNKAYFLSFAVLFILFMAIIVLLRGIDDEIFESPLMRVFGAMVLFLSIAHAFVSSPATNLVEHEKNDARFFKVIFSPDYCPEQKQPVIEKREAYKVLKDLAGKQCLLQSNEDMTAFARDLGKAIYLNSAMGLTDSLYNDFVRKKPIRCDDLVKELEALCPSVYQPF